MKTHSVPLSSRRDAVLIRIFQKGYEPAFKILVNRHSPRLKTFLRKKLHNSDLEKDVCQVTWMQAFQQFRAHQYIEKGHFTAWLCRLAYFNAVSVLRKEKRFVHNEDLNVLEKTCFYQPDYLKKEQIAQLKQALGVLNQRMRTIVILRAEKDLTFHTIAHKLHCSVSSVSSAYSKAIKKLRKFYEKEI